MSLFRVLFHIILKYLLDIVSPIVGWCLIGTFTDPWEKHRYSSPGSRGHFCNGSARFPPIKAEDYLQQCLKGAMHGQLSEEAKKSLEIWGVAASQERFYQDIFRNAAKIPQSGYIWIDGWSCAASVQLDSHHLLIWRHVDALLNGGWWLSIFRVLLYATNCSSSHFETRTGVAPCCTRAGQLQQIFEGPGSFLPCADLIARKVRSDGQTIPCYMLGL